MAMRKITARDDKEGNDRRRTEPTPEHVRPARDVTQGTYQMAPLGLNIPLAST
jgi:hypothetical protein